MLNLGKIICLVLIVVVASGPPAPGLTEGDLVIQQHTVDLDGDGNIDHITAAFYKSGGYGFDHVVLEVNASTVLARGTVMKPTLYFVDIDGSDPFREIAVFESGPSDDPATHFFRFGNGVIAELGTIPGRATGPPQVNGSGRVQTKCRGSVLETWWYPCEFEYSRYSSRLEAAIQQWKPMDAQVTLLTELTLVTSPRDPAPAGAIMAGDRATVLKTDDKEWCYIESESGVAGWFGLIGCCRVASSGLSVYEVFDGLHIAD